MGAVAPKKKKDRIARRQQLQYVQWGKMVLEISKSDSLQK